MVFVCVCVCVCTLKHAPCSTLSPCLPYIQCHRLSYLIMWACWMCVFVDCVGESGLYDVVKDPSMPLFL